MLPKHYRNRYALIFVLSLLIHALIVGVLLWGISEQEEKPKKKSVVVKLKHIDHEDKKKTEAKKTEPKKAEPKKAEPKKAEPKKAEPKKAEPKKAEPKKAKPKKADKKSEPKKAEPKKAEPKKAEPKKKAKTSKVEELDQKKNINKQKSQTSKKDLKPAHKRQKKVGSMQMLDDTQMKNMFIATSGASQKFQDRNVRGLSAVRNLNVIERQEFDLFFSKGADRILKNYIAPKKDGREYSGKIAILINKDGYITNVRFKKRSGHDGLDLAMFNAVNKTPRLALPRDPEAAYAMYTMPMVLWYNQDDMAD